MVDRKPSGAVRPPSSPTVVSERGILQGILHSKTCRKCGALHGMSYADGGSGLPSGNVCVCVWVWVCVYVELLDHLIPILYFDRGYNLECNILASLRGSAACLAGPLGPAHEEAGAMRSRRD